MASSFLNFYNFANFKVLFNNDFLMYMLFYQYFLHHHNLHIFLNYFHLHAQKNNFSIFKIIVFQCILLHCHFKNYFCFIFYFKLNRCFNSFIFLYFQELNFIYLKNFFHLNLIFVICFQCNLDHLAFDLKKYYVFLSYLIHFSFYNFKSICCFQFIWVHFVQSILNSYIQICKNHYVELAAMNATLFLFTMEYSIINSYGNCFCNQFKYSFFTKKLSFFNNLNYNLIY